MVGEGSCLALKLLSHASLLIAEPLRSTDANIHTPKGWEVGLGQVINGI